METEGVVIAVDGPAGAGKSTVSQRLATHFGYCYFDSGALYRGVTWLATQRGIPPTAQDSVLVDLCKELDLTFVWTDKGWRAQMGRKDVTDVLKGEEVGEGASLLSARPALRAALVDLQRAQRTPQGLVMEGRDIGTVVFPSATLKFFCTADPRTRAKRRFEELRALGKSVELERVHEEILKRDERDRTRKIAPLVAAEDAFRIDTTDLTVDEVVENIVIMCT